MDLKKTMLCLSLITPFGFAAVQAEQPSYNFVDAGYVELDLDEVSLDPSGFFIRGSVEVAENWFIRAGYVDADDSSGFLDVGADQFNLGGGYKAGLSDNTTVHVTLDYISAEAKARNRFGGRAEVDEDGYGLGVGIRSMVTPSIELNAGAGYADLGEEDGLEFDAGAVWYVTENLGLLIEAGTDDDSNRQYMIGGRLAF